MTTTCSPMTSSAVTEPATKKARPATADTMSTNGTHTQQQQQQVDTIVHARWIVPIEPAHTILEHHSLVVKGQLIHDILPTKDAQQRYTATATHSLADHHVLLPGLVNAHTHIGMTLLRGFSDDLPLSDWLMNEIFPAEAKFMSHRWVTVNTQAGLYEMLRTGTTCFNDMYLYPNAIAEVVDAVGARATIGNPLLEFPTAYASGPDEYLSKAAEQIQQYKQHERISSSIAPHAPYTVHDTRWKQIKQFAEQHDVQIHTHLHETQFEVDHSVNGSGHAKHMSDNLCSPLENFEKMGLLSDRLIAAHMVALSDADVNVVAKHGVNIAHCPQSNQKLASGFCPTAKLIKAGVNVAIGTDSTASNNRLDMFAELKSASILSKGLSQTATAMPAFDALKAATLNGAKAMKIDNKVGSLVKGKLADFIAVDMSALELQPIFNIISHLAYAVQGVYVTDVWVAGKQLLKDRQTTTIDAAQLSKDINAIATEVAAFKEVLKQKHAQPVEAEPKQVDANGKA